MIRTLRHAAALTDHREHERLDQSLLQSVQDLVSGTRRARLQARLWRLSGPGEDAPLMLAAKTAATEPAPHPTRDLHASTGEGTERLDPCPVDEVASPSARQALVRAAVLTAMHPHRREGLNCLTWVPIARHGQSLGVLEIESAAPLSPSRLTLVQGMCSLYANHLSLLHESQVDTLTQLLNRKTFDDSIQRLLHAGQCTAEPTWVAVIDIDHFKRINDGYGHLFGDEVLLLVAGMLRRSFRHQDKVFRFGGEEFVVLLQNLSPSGALSALQRLRTTIQDHRFPQVGQVTISIGATAIQPGDAACDALGRADDALYHAKSHGRNQVCVFENLQAEGAISPHATVHGDVDLF
jgi:diguanylate cyclase (GGDEF)-like protein